MKFVVEKNIQRSITRVADLCLCHILLKSLHARNLSSGLSVEQHTSCHFFVNWMILALFKRIAIGRPFKFPLVGSSVVVKVAKKAVYCCPCQCAHSCSVLTVCSRFVGKFLWLLLSCF